MGYHHEHDGPAEAAESLLDHRGLSRRERRELLPLEVRRLLWEGACLVRLLADGTVAIGVCEPVQLDLPLSQGCLHRLLPDREVPVLCVVPHGADAEPVAGPLLALGYRHVFIYAGALLPG